MPRKKASSQRKVLTGLTPSAFQHSADREALRKLDHLPGMQLLLRKVSGSYVEKTLQMLNVSQNIRVSSKQFPQVHNLFREACDVLDIKEMPEIYIATAYIPNAFTFGMEKYSVTLLSGVLDLLTEEELLFVIAHELTHIKCNHMMYKTLLYLLSYVGTELFGLFFKVAAITFFPIEMALRSWERKAEFSCDRGGLLVVQNAEVAKTTMAKLSGFSKSLKTQVNIQEILKQADELKDMDDQLFVRVMKMYHTAFRSHPFPIIRIKELHNWSQSNQYHRILSGEYQNKAV
ncbi:M48 family metallopeptidase [bacterium]|nr:M48 family metallopeptidase [bacterium]MCI0604782.1 M48 family metallopeptidase [bacterium]